MKILYRGLCNIVDCGELVSPSALISINTIREGIAADLNLKNLERLQLWYLGRRLSDGRTLFDYRFKDGHVIQVWRNENEPQPRTTRPISRTPPKVAKIIKKEGVTQLSFDKHNVSDQDCLKCGNHKQQACQACGCKLCGGKQDEKETVLCDECEGAYHLKCLKLKKLPEDEWYCPTCKHCERCKDSPFTYDVDSLPDIKGKDNMPSARQIRDWGRGEACSGKSKDCIMVQSEHRGPIPGIPVGSRWGLRVYAAESGVHRPLVAGIAGGSKHGAVSIVLAGGYPEDVDNGMEFLYTGSGGRELSEGNKRVAEQTSDQQLTNFNKALAMTCHCAFNKHGGTAKDWRQSSPIRVCRSAKLKNKYSPDEGVRYDGIYKIVKYWQEKGKDSVHKVWRFKFRRDDTEPAPWTAAGKARTERLGLVLDDRRFPSIRRTVLELHPELLKFMSKDVVNQDRWKRIQGREFTNFPEMMDVIFRDVFSCEICTNIFDQPVSTPCGHTFCGICFVKSCECMNSIECPSCRLKFEEGATAPNIALQVIFGALKKPKEEYMSVKRLPGFNDENKDKKATSKNDSPATATSNSSSKVRVTLSRGKTKSAAASLSDAMVPSTNSTAAFTSLSRETATLLTPRATPTRATSMSPDLFTVKKETVENALTFIRATRSNKNPELLALNDDPEVIFRQRHSRTSHSNQRPELTPVKEEIIESTSFSSRTTRPTRSRKDSELIARSDDPEEFFRRRHSRISLSCEQPSTVTKLVRVKDEPEEDLLPSRRHTNLYQDQEIRGHDTAGSRLKRTAPVESRETEEEEGSSLRLFSKRSRVVHVNLPLA